MIFNGEDFFYLKDKKWSVGEIFTKALSKIEAISENCSIVSVKDEYKDLQTRLGHLLITGGY
jgi:hypothetical protein